MASPNACSSHGWRDLSAGSPTVSILHMHATKRHPPFWAISRLPGDHPHTFPSGTGKRVAVDISGGPYIDLEREAQAMLARE
jgi:hypothetical protein